MIVSRPYCFIAQKRSHSAGGTCPEHKQAVKTGIRGGLVLFRVTNAAADIAAPRNASINGGGLR
jgi:hypothetical protein